MDNKQQAQSLAREGNVLLSLDKNAYAERKFGEALVKDPTNYSALYGLGVSLEAQGKVVEALQEWQRGLGLHSKVEGFYFLLTNSFLNQHKVTEAQQYNDEWLKNFPNSGQAHRFRSRVIEAQAPTALDKLLYWKEIIFHAQEARRLAPWDAVNAAHLAHVLWEYQQNKKAANEEFLFALRLNPENASIHSTYGAFLVKSGDIETGFQEFRHAIRLDPTSEIIAHNVGRIIACKHPLLKWTYLTRHWIRNLAPRKRLFLLVVIICFLVIIAVKRLVMLQFLVVCPILFFIFYEKFMYRLLYYAFKKGWING